MQLQYRVANNYDEYLEICKELRYKRVAESIYGTKVIPFSDTQDWEEFFNVELQTTESGYYKESVKNFKGNIEMKPKKSEYPVLVAFKFEKSMDRRGDLSVQMWDWTPLKKLGLQLGGNNVTN